MSKNRICFGGTPDNWARITQIIPPEQPTKKEIEEALQTMIEDAPELANYADDLMAAFEKLLADQKYLKKETRLQVRNYHSELNAIWQRTKRLMALMQEDYEKATTAEEDTDGESLGG